MSLNRTFCLIAAACLSATHAQAGRTCRLVYPERPNSAPKTAFIFDGKLSKQVMLPSMNFSPVLELPDGNLTIAMTAQQITNPGGLPADTPMLRIPEHVRDFYIIITPKPDNKTFPVQMNLVDTGGSKLKPGQTLWYNLTNHRIIAKLGESDMKVEPNGKTITDAPLTDSGYYVAKIGYQADGTAPLAPITKQSWWHDANSRHLGFIANTGGKLPKLYYFRDFRLPEEVMREIEEADPKDTQPVLETQPEPPPAEPDQQAEAASGDQ